VEGGVWGIHILGAPTFFEHGPRLELIRPCTKVISMTMWNVCGSINTKHKTIKRFQSFTILHMYDNIVKSSVISKITQDSVQMNTSTSNNTEARTIVSTKTTNDTLQPSAINTAFATMFIHVTFHSLASERVEIFLVAVVFKYVDGDLTVQRVRSWSTNTEHGVRSTIDGRRSQLNRTLRRNAP